MQALRTLHKQSLYRQLAERIRSSVAGGEFPTGKLPTEKQLAAQYGVSVVTVRSALKALTEEGLVRRRQGLGTFLAGWHARPAARSRSSGLLAYISGAGSENVPGNFFNTLMLAAQRAAEALGFSTVLSTAVERELPSPVLKRRVDAAILAGTFRDPRHGSGIPGTLEEENLAYLRSLAQSRIPAVSVSNHGDWPAIHRVLPDYDDAMARALDLLLAQGHQRIALWGGPFLWPAFRARRDAFLRAAQARGLPADASAIIAIDDFSYRNRLRYGRELAEWLAAHRETTALISVSGPAALAVHAAKSSHRQVPDDLSVIALTDAPPPQDPSVHFDDPDQEVPTRLTAFALPVEGLATAAVARAVHLAKGLAIAEEDRTQRIPLVYYAGESVARRR